MNKITERDYWEKYEEIMAAVKAGTIADSAAALRLSLLRFSAPQLIGIDYGRDHRPFPEQDATT